MKTIAHPLQSIVARAAGTLPATTGVVAPYAERQRRLDTGSGTTVLADVSSSMEERAWGGMTKHALLRDAIAGVMRPGVTILAFSAGAYPVSRIEDLPEPHGNTALHRAIEQAASQHPARMLIVSDGHPDDEEKARSAAQAFPGVIDVLYIGPDSDKGAIAFLSALAKGHGGRYRACDVRSAVARPLLLEVTTMLQLEAPR